MTQNDNQFINQILQSENKNSSAALKSFFSDKRVLITGAAGSIGSEVVHFLSTCNCDKLILLDTAETALHNLLEQLEENSLAKNIEPCITNVCNRERIGKIIKSEKPNFIFHAAAYKHVPLMEKNPIEAFTTNFYGTKIVSDCAVKEGVEKFVYVSTDKAVYPSSIMGTSKRLAEIYINSLGKNDKTKFITTRFGTVIGSNGSVFHKFKRQIERGGPVTVTHPEVSRYIMTINDARNLVLKAMVYGEMGEIFLHEMGKPLLIMDFAKQMIDFYKNGFSREIKIEIEGLRPGEKLNEILFYDDEVVLETDDSEIKILKNNSNDFDFIKAKTEELASLIEHDNLESFLNGLSDLVAVQDLNMFMKQN